jgi:alpha-beta hydrolase superfamily lysophospholipase
MLRRLRRFVVYLSCAVALVLATIVLTFAVQARLRLPALRAWHRVHLTQEFRADRAGAPKSFDEYLRLEDRLFAELRKRVMDDPAAQDSLLLGRYNPNSVPAHLALDTTYNRSYELVPKDPQGGVLLVHGLTDSPYSMRALAETFFAKGYYVLVLRLPGHGTVPASLTDVSWKDWYASIVLAAEHVGQRAGKGNPVLACGHSTGAALLALYAVRALDDPQLPRLDHLYLISPAIGISRFAVLTNVLAGLSFVPYFEKSEWLDVQPEYDPYKYNSFPVNAANQIHTLTGVLRRALDDAGHKGKLGAMPRVLVFQSLVDSTVTAAEVVRGLLALLPKGGNELCVFDVNRRDRLEGLLAPGPLEELLRLKAAPDLPFRLTIVGNRSARSRRT